MGNILVVSIRGVRCCEGVLRGGTSVKGIKGGKGKGREGKEREGKGRKEEGREVVKVKVMYVIVMRARRDL